MIKRVRLKYFLLSLLFVCRLRNLLTCWMYKNNKVWILSLHRLRSSAISEVFHCEIVVIIAMWSSNVDPEPPPKRPSLEIDRPSKLIVDHFESLQDTLMKSINLSFFHLSLFIFIFIFFCITLSPNNRRSTSS